MAKFIPIDKMTKLREASKNGDANAIKILDLQMSGEDFGSLLDEYFQPKPEQVSQAQVEVGKSLPNKGEQSNLDKFLAFNGVTKDSPDYESFVEDFYNEFPNERPKEMGGIGEHCEVGEDCFILPLIQEEIKAISDYNEAIMKVMDMDELGDAAKRGMISKLEEIKRDEMEHLEELKRMKNGLTKKEEKAEAEGEENYGQQ